MGFFVIQFKDDFIYYHIPQKWRNHTSLVSSCHYLPQLGSWWKFIFNHVLKVLKLRRQSSQLLGHFLLCLKAFYIFSKPFLNEYVIWKQIELLNSKSELDNFSELYWSERSGMHPFSHNSSFNGTKTREFHSSAHIFPGDFSTHDLRHRAFIFDT